MKTPKQSPYRFSQIHPRSSPKAKRARKVEIVRDNGIRSNWRTR